MFYYVVIAAAAGFIASILADKYGRNTRTWFWVCFICPPAIAVLLILSENAEYFRREEFKKQQAEEYNEYTECPYCAERIKKKAKVCKHCGRDIVPREIEL